MKRVLLLLFALISLNAFSQLQDKEGSFKRIDGEFIEDKEEYTDGNDLPMALIKITIENIDEQERLRFVFRGNRATQIIKKPRNGQMCIYISADAATFIEIKHPDYGVCKYYLTESLCDYCVYEMVVQYTVLEQKYGCLIISSEPTEANIYIDGQYYDKTDNVIVDLIVGTHELKLEKEGMETLVKSIEIKQDEALELNEKLSYQKYVDLGLSVKWATCNVGAEKPEEYGDHFAWGEKSTRESYDTKSSVTFHKEMFDISGNADYDVATANMGKMWRIPTQIELKELKEKCTWTWISENDVKGYKVTGPNGNSIFLPVTGYYCCVSHNSVKEYGFYWSSTPVDNDVSSYCVEFGPKTIFMRDGYDRYYGLSIRPVVDL